MHCVHAFQTGYGRAEKVLSLDDVIVLMNFSIRDAGLLSAQHASVQRVCGDGAVGGHMLSVLRITSGHVLSLLMVSLVTEQYYLELNDVWTDESPGDTALNT